MQRHHSNLPSASSHALGVLGRLMRAFPARAVVDVGDVVDAAQHSATPVAVGPQLLTPRHQGLLGRLVRGHPTEQGTAGQHLEDRRSIGGRDGHPVAHGGLGIQANRRPEHLGAGFGRGQHRRPVVADHPGRLRPGWEFVESIGTPAVRLQPMVN